MLTYRCLTSADQRWLIKPYKHQTSTMNLFLLQFLNLKYQLIFQFCNWDLCLKKMLFFNVKNNWRGFSMIIDFIIKIHFLTAFCIPKMTIKSRNASYIQRQIIKMIYNERSYTWFLIGLFLRFSSFKQRISWFFASLIWANKFIWKSRKYIFLFWNNNSLRYEYWSTCIDFKLCCFKNNVWYRLP